MAGGWLHSGIPASGANDTDVNLSSIITGLLRIVGSRQRRFRLLWVVTVLLGFVLLLSWNSPASVKGESASISLQDVDVHHPSQPQTRLSDNTSPLRSQSKITPDGDLPKELKKESPSFHVLVRSSGIKSKTGLCRTLYSAMVHNYPPPTLIGTALHPGINYVEDINKFLSGGRDNNQIKDNDVVLIIDEDDVWFQLPAELLLERFQSIIHDHNNRLYKKYGPATGVEWDDKEHRKSTQKYSERIIFAADKLCDAAANQTNVVCTAAPPSPLLPDIYGENTDRSSNIARNRPRWLNSGTVIGTQADLRLLYGHAAEMDKHSNRSMTESQLLGEIFGNQEYVRELNRRNIASWTTRIAETLGIFPKVDISNTTVELSPTTRYDYGIGLDYKSQLFFPMSPHSKRDLHWLRYDDVPTISEIQMKQEVPRFARINLPDDIAKLKSPFIPVDNSTAKMIPALDKKIDVLPNAQNTSWTNVSLATNVFSVSVPALLRMNATDHKHTPPHLWTKMWYYPWSRALLRNYMRTAITPTSVASSLRGGEDSWDMRGGKGGIWTGTKQWVEWGEVCSGFEWNVFGDDFGVWGHEITNKSASLNDSTLVGLRRDPFHF